MAGLRLSIALVLVGLAAAPWQAIGQQTQVKPEPGEQQQGGMSGGISSAGTFAPVYDAQKRPITAGGFVDKGTVVFEDVSKSSRLASWRHVMGTAQKKYILETDGSGVGLIDYDNDGWLDIYLVNGSTYDALTGKKTPPHAALFHNNHDGTFTDVAEKAGVSNDRWGFGVAIGDFDNDGWPDIFVCNFGKNRLYRNNHDGTFTDVAEKAGVTLGNWSDGATWGDYDGDGRLDLFVSGYVHYDLNHQPDSDKGGVPFAYCQLHGFKVMCGPRGLPGEPDHLFHNNGDGTFTDRAAQAGLSDQLGGLNMVQTDYNNDGCLDILVLRGGWQLPVRRSLLRNNCNGTFTDVTSASGLAQPATSTQTAVWADINNDGLLDLFLGRENRPAQLFLNRGDGTFKDISHSAGVDRIAFTKGVAAADYDNDGYVDLYVSNLDGDNFLYHNNHNNTFTEVAEQAGVPGSGHGFPTWFFDYDNDGWPDIFVTSFFPSVDESLRSYLDLPHNATTLKLYRNLGNGHFRDVTADVGLEKVLMPMGANYGDIDNDGFLDIYLGTGNPSYAALVPNALLRNDEGKRFVDVTASSGTGELHKGHGVAFADIDRDGDEDLLEEEGGAVPGDRHAYRLFENPGNGNDWINLKLVGVKSNRPAVGARIKVAVTSEGQGTRSIYRTVSSGGSFGASPFEQHIGLGKSARILSIEIWWPASRTRQIFTNVGRNQFLEIKEFASDYTKLVRSSFRLGGPRRQAEASPGGREALR